ncbi:hypothetical protein FACS189427_05710 [Planctomycetales bacterium]|nr:hypothetical protein FACS189427_05710 [Planctomycetales bacterium]
MRKFWFGFLGTVAAAAALHFTQVSVNAGLFSDCSPCDPCKPVCETACDPCEPVCGSKGKWFVTGHLEVGFWANEYGQKTWYDPADTTRHNLGAWRGNDPDGDAEFLYNTKTTGAQLNQLYISAGKSVDGRHGWDFGGTADFTFGTDASMVQATGLEIDPLRDKEGWGTGDYYSAFAQAYFEAEYKKWNIKAGKFYAPFGSEGYKSTDRFFYTLADTWGVVPATASGAYATYTVNKNLSVYGGWVKPDNFFRDSSTSRSNAFLGGANWQYGKLGLAYALAFGEDSAADVDAPFGLSGLPHSSDFNYFVQSFVATYQVNKKLKYTFDWTLYNDVYKGSYANTPSYGSANLRNTNSKYAISQSLIYEYNKKWAFGARFGWSHEGSGEFYHDEDPNAWDAGNYWYTKNNNSDRYDISLGANWTPRKWLLIKPEIRYDIVDNNQSDGVNHTVGPETPYKTSTRGVANYAKPGTSNGTPKKDQLSGGVSAIVKF